MECYLHTISVKSQLIKNKYNKIKNTQYRAILAGHKFGRIEFSWYLIYFDKLAAINCLKYNFSTNSV